MEFKEIVLNSEEIEESNVYLGRPNASAVGANTIDLDKLIESQEPQDHFCCMQNGNTMGCLSGLINCLFDGIRKTRTFLYSPCIVHVSKSGEQEEKRSQWPDPLELPVSKKALDMILLQEPYDPTKETEKRPNFVSKSSITREFLENAIKKTVAFGILTAKQRRRVIDVMSEIKFEEGRTVLQQNDLARNYSIIESGTLLVGYNEIEFKLLNEGKSFGEGSIVHDNRIPNFTVDVLESGALWTVDRTTFRRALINLAYESALFHARIMRSLPMLPMLTMEESFTLAERMELKLFSEGQVIIKEGDIENSFYIIESGVVIISKDGQEINQLSTGGYFGNLHLNRSGSSLTTVTTAEKVECVVLSKSSLIKEGPLYNFLKKSSFNRKR
jgi:CRP-like cAMP-binding protein